MSNLDRLKAAYKTWSDTKGARPQVWLDLMAEEFALRSMGADKPGLTFAMERISRQHAVDYMTELLRDWSMVYWQPETFVCEGNCIAVFGRSAWINNTTNKSAELRVAHLWRFRDDQAVSLDEVFDSARAVAAATP